MIDYLSYPNPMFVRENMELLDGQWNVDIISTDAERTHGPIQVPFCPESILSGIAYKKRIENCTYSRQFYVELENLQNRKMLLHFGAVDYESRVFINNRCVGTHKGGYTPFCFDITQYLHAGNNYLFVEVSDHTTNRQAHGKQTHKDYSFGCFYTRVTGIWQSVWMETVPEHYVKSFRLYPDAGNGKVLVDLLTEGCQSCKIEVFYEGNSVGYAAADVNYRKKISIDLSEKHLWEVGSGRLYDVVITFGEDVVYTYFGLRDVGYRGYDFMINEKPVFQKLVLDQGYNPEGIYTAPDLEYMKRDIQLGLDLGFNGVRLHEKVFDPKMLYLCDKAGYMVWGEFPSWGVDFSDMRHAGQFLSEWQEVLERDFNHPSIIIWCPLNEVWGDWDDPRKYRDVNMVETIYEFTKRYDPTRPCVDTSGGHHGSKTDLYDFHTYEDLKSLKEVLDNLQNNDVLDVALLYTPLDDLRYKKGLPVMVSECGGIAFGSDYREDATNTINVNPVEQKENWGYGKCEKNDSDLVCRYKALVELIRSYSKISGFCYTQLYDVEQETNGFYTYDRQDKLSAKNKLEIKVINDSL